MQEDFAKLYRTFFTGSMRRESDATRLIFLACLTLADRCGEFTAEPDFIASYANEPLDITLAALERLQSPDENSSSQDEDGRRLMKIGPNRWKVVNKGVYRGKSAKADYMREYMRQRRAANKSDSKSTVVNPVNPVNVKENKSNSKERKQEKKETETLRPEYAAAFENLKAAYPPKEGGYRWQAAEVAFTERLIKSPSPEDEAAKIVAGAKRYAASIKRTKKFGYVLNPAKFIAESVYLESFEAARREPQDGIDYYMIGEYWLYIDGEPIEAVERGHRPEDGEVHEVVVRKKIVDGNRTNEKFDLSEWKDAQGL